MMVDAHSFVLAAAVVALPASASRDHILEWINDALGYGSGMSTKNPLCDQSFSAIAEPILSRIGSTMGPTAIEPVAKPVKGAVGMPEARTTAFGSLIPKGRVIRVVATFSTPVEAREDQVLEWLGDAFGAGTGMAMDNPLFAHGAKAVVEPLLSDTGMVFEETVTEVQTASGEKQFARRGLMVRDRRDETAISEWRSGQEKLMAMRERGGCR